MARAAQARPGRIIARIALKASPAAKTIKLADLIDNTRSIVERDPKFAEVYMAEKTMLLEVLTEGAPELMAMARQAISEYQESRQTLPQS